MLQPSPRRRAALESSLLPASCSSSSASPALPCLYAGRLASQSRFRTIRVHYPRAMLLPLRRFTLVALVALLSLTVFGCGGDDGSEDTSSTSTTTGETEQS